MATRLGRLFHREHPTPIGELAKPTSHELLEQWSRGPGGRCDLCSRPIEGDDSRRVPNATFKSAARSGYDPFARGRAPESSAALAAAVGRTASDSYQAWRETVARDTTDWALCPVCAVDVARFIAGEEPMTLTEAQTTFLEDNFGADVSRTLVDHLGHDGAATFALELLDAARERWSHRNDAGFLTDAEREQMFKQSREAGLPTIELRAAFQVVWMAGKVATDAAAEAVEREHLPAELVPELAEQLRHHLD